MNILFLTYGHVSKMRGGIDRVTDVLGRSLIQRNHNVYMISVCKPHEDDSPEPYQYILPQEYILSQENARYLFDFLISNKIDIIINQSERLAILQLALQVKNRIPIVSVVHTDPLFVMKGVRDNWDYWKLYEQRWKFFLLFPYYVLRIALQYWLRFCGTKKHHRYFYENSDGIVLLSERFKKSFLDLIGIKQSEKLFSISNPLSYQSVGNIEELRKEKIVLYVSRLEYSPKRLDRILKAWNMIRDHAGWRLMVVGDGPDATFYKQVAMRHQLQDVDFIGQTNPVDLYKKAQILCISSTCEGFSLVLTEALQHGVIPVAFDSFESVHDIISTGENGFLVKPFRFRHYANILKKLMSDEHLRQRVQLNIQTDSSYFNRFDINHITDEWDNLLSYLMKKKS